MRRQGGFTLIELIVVLSIAAIMAAIAMPSFSNFIASQRAKSASYELTTTLLLARSEAIKRNANVQVAPTSSGVWATGWALNTVPAASAPLQAQQTLSGVTISTTTSSVTFAGTGRPSASAKWEISSNGKSTRCVKLDTAGSTSTSTGACT